MLNSGLLDGVQDVLPTGTSLLRELGGAECRTRARSVASAIPRVGLGSRLNH